MVKVIKLKRSGILSFRHAFWCNTCNTKSDDIEVARGTKKQSPGYPDPVPEAKLCQTCGSPAKFTSFGSWSVWIREDTGEEVLQPYTLPGALYEEEEGYWDRASRTHRFGPDGRCLTVVCPDGVAWCIDSRASNCDMRHDNTHRCWTRDPNGDDLHITVAKHFGPTCGAGAGSIVTHKGGHWFLRNGEFVNC